MTLAGKKALTAYAFLAIPLLFFVGVRFGPMLYMMAMSLTDWSLLRKTLHFVGLENFRADLRRPGIPPVAGQHRPVRGLRRADRHRPQPRPRPPARPRTEGQGPVPVHLCPALHHPRGGGQLGLALDVPDAAPRHPERGPGDARTARHGVPQQSHPGPSFDSRRQRLDRARLLHDRVPGGHPDHSAGLHRGGPDRRRIGAEDPDRQSCSPSSCPSRCS